jgi:Holliday junction resolvase RusA-like endonuclease
MSGAQGIAPTASEDRDRLLSLYSVMAGQADDGTERIAFTTIPGAPASKSRVRFGKGHAYSSADMRAAEQRTAWFLKSALGEPMQGNIFVACIFFRPNRQRIDVDNMLKHICDAANGIIWKDDSQVTAIAGIAEYDKENPRTAVIIGEHDSSLVRGVRVKQDCSHCGEPFAIKDRAMGQALYCSPACRRKAVFGDLPPSQPRNCPSCGVEFTPRDRRAKYCSKLCARIASRGRPRLSAQRPKRSCEACGKPIAHTSRGLCRPCWLDKMRREREVRSA